MEKVAILIVTLLLFACNGSNKTEQTEKAVREFMESYANEHTDVGGISATYDEKGNCIEMSMKGELMTIDYKLRFKDLLTDNPQSYADGFIISMVIPGIKSVTDMVIVIDEVTFHVVPFHAEQVGENLYVLGFSERDDDFSKCMNVLGRIQSPSSAYLNTNKGKIKIPYEDVSNLQAMAKSYIMDGGKFGK